MSSGAKRGLGWALGALLLIVLGWWGWQRFRPYAFHGTVLQSAEPAPDFTLMSADGPVSLSDFRGRIVMLYFGYTFCPDVCPTTLFEVQKTMELLGEDADQVQLIMISVDPLRDTPERLKEYVQYFHPSFIGVTGSEDEIAQVATQYGIYYEKHEGTPATGYLVDHTATLTVVDRKGYVKLIFPYGTPAEDMAADLKYLIEH
ncbi:MAG: SCO family protein [Chloroflexi bacterium]|nr:SCO family protein [Chloroflexota bacterium]